ncbi:MAG: endonuclease [Pseudonocardiaceae bacterium]|nr:endonuclease [Pseudonocardiaceae bacterium]
MAGSDSAKVRALLDNAGQTYATEAGIEIADKPAPLYRLAVLSLLLSTRIKAGIAVSAARELSAFGTPQRMLDASWQQRVDTLGRGHYVRYDESTATALGEGAQLLLDEYRGDLRRMREQANGDVGEFRGLLCRLPKIGPVGAHIFCREVQQVWPELRPYLDAKALDGAKAMDLPADAKELAKLVSEDDLARFAAALVRVALDKKLAKSIASGE